MQLVIAPDGTVRCLYGEAVDLLAFGRLTIARAAHVEPDGQGSWSVDLTPVGGPRLTGFRRRSAALAAERAWLLTDWLGRPCGC